MFIHVSSVQILCANVDTESLHECCLSSKLQCGAEGQLQGKWRLMEPANIRLMLHVVVHQFTSCHVPATEVLNFWCSWIRAS